MGRSRSTSLASGRALPVRLLVDAVQHGSKARPAWPRDLRPLHPSIYPADGDWAAWCAELRGRIVFVESTGFWWQEDPTLPARDR